MNIKNVDWREVAKYIAVMFTEEEIKEEGLDKVVPRRESNRKVTINYLQSKQNDNNWVGGRKPGVNQQKKMLAMAISKGVFMVMSNHTYRVGDNVYKQTEGGPIGLELTGAADSDYEIL